MASRTYHPGDFWAGTNAVVKQYEIDRMADDGCPHCDRVDAPVFGVRHIQPSVDKDWLDFSDRMSRVYICQGHDYCKRYCWHPIGRCHGCGAKMVLIKGYQLNLEEYLRVNGYKDSGY